jgi:hypothetical protein
MSEPTKIGKVGYTDILVQNGPEEFPQVTVTSGGRAFGWTADDAEQIAGLLLRAARVARSQAGCIRSDP